MQMIHMLAKDGYVALKRAAEDRSNVVDRHVKASCIAEYWRRSLPWHNAVVEGTAWSWWHAIAKWSYEERRPSSK